MANINDYIIWRGDLSFDNSELNEVDKIIFARLSYLPFKEIAMNAQERIYSIANKMLKVKENKYLWKDDVEFIKLLGTSQRFKDIAVSDYVEQLDEKAEKQFSAITIKLPNNKIYISFRGTDTSLVGWKEDFNLSFMYNISSQREGVKYLENIARKYTDKQIYIGGHSKGGNVAVYSAIFCEQFVKDRIIEIINADGPGFNKQIISDVRYKNILHKIKTYIPQSSYIGRILEHEEDYIVIKSNQKGIMQHDLYSWEVGPTFLIELGEVTKESEFVDNLVMEWLKTTTPKARKNFIDIAYEILSASDAKNTGEIAIGLIKNSKKILSKYKSIPIEEKKELDNMIKHIFGTFSKLIKKEMLGFGKKDTI